MKYTTLLLTACSSFALFSCGEKETTDTDPSSSPASGTSLATVMVKAEPAGAKSITEVRKSAKVGSEITLAGKVMGSSEPFVEGRAIVLLGDPAIITSCDLRPGDSCQQPWDVCCDDAEDIKAAIATIQVVDADGRPLKQGLKGTNGMKELSNVVIKGIVAEGSSANNLLVNATAIFVKP